MRVSSSVIISVSTSAWSFLGPLWTLTLILIGNVRRILKQKNVAKFTQYVLKLELDDFFRPVLFRLKRQIQRKIRICFWLLWSIIEGISNYIPLLIRIVAVFLKFVIIQGSGRTRRLTSLSIHRVLAFCTVLALLSSEVDSWRLTLDSPLLEILASYTPISEITAAIFLKLLQRS